MPKVRQSGRFCRSGFGQNPLFVCKVMRVGRKGILNFLFETFGPVVSGMGHELLDVEFSSDAGRPVLRFTIYNPKGITLDDCVSVDRAIDPVLEELDPIPGSYNLEVSSPGLERTLKRDREYELFSGYHCKVNLFGPVKGKRTFEGVLVGLGESSGQQTVVIKSEKGDIAFPRSSVSKVQLVYKDNRPSG